MSATLTARELDVMVLLTSFGQACAANDFNMGEEMKKLVYKIDAIYTKGYER